MKLWLDDIRKPPWGYDLWAKSYAECVEMLAAHPIDHISLDHDLAPEHYADGGHFDAPKPAESRAKNGYDVALWMVEHGKVPADVVVHSLNPSGRADILRLLRRHAPSTTTITERPFANVI